MGITITFSILILIVIGVVEAIKRTKLAPARFLPVIAIVLGIIASAIGGLEATIVANILPGIAIGLSAVGLFSGVKNVLVSGTKKK